MKTSYLLLATVLMFTTAQAQEAVMRDGRPALKFSGNYNDCVACPTIVTSSVVEDAGTTDHALLFLVSTFRPDCPGWMRVTATTVSWEPLQPSCPVAKSALQRSEIGGEEFGRFFPVRGVRVEFGAWDVDQGYFVRSNAMLRLFDLSLRDFSSAYEEFRRLTSSVRVTMRIASQPGNVQVLVDDKLMGTTSVPDGELVVDSLPPGSHSLRLTAAGYKNWSQAVTLTAGSSTNIEAKLVALASPLVIQIQPANVQVYVDDAFRGMTSSEGRLMVEGLAPGTHRVRMNLLGYTEAAQTVELKAGETATIEAKLEPAGPKPMALAEIEEALSKGLPPKGITKLVNQYGVDFALTKEVEQRLRDKGADSDLLLAIATNKK